MNSPSPADALGFRGFAQRHILARIQERTCANLFALLRFIDEKRTHPRLASLRPRISNAVLPGYRFVAHAGDFSAAAHGGAPIEPDRGFDVLLAAQASADVDCLLGFCQWARANRLRIEHALLAEYRHRFRRDLIEMELA